MKRFLPLLVAVLATSGCFEPDDILDDLLLPCETDSPSIDGSVVTSGGDALVPSGTPWVFPTKSPDDCVSGFEITVFGGDSTDCRITALADGPATGDRMEVTALSIWSDAECPWPAAIQGEFAATGDNWIEWDGALDLTAETDNGSVCLTGDVRLVLDATVPDAVETLVGTWTFADGIVATVDDDATCAGS